MKDLDHFDAISVKAGFNINIYDYIVSNLGFNPPKKTKRWQRWILNGLFRVRKLVGYPYWLSKLTIHLQMQWIPGFARDIVKRRIHAASYGMSSERFFRTSIND